MGTSIGQISASLIAARRETPVVQPSSQTDRPAFAFPQPNDAEQSVPQSGFGPGTVSGPAAALVALGRGVEAAREAVPTLDEIRARFQASRAARNVEAEPESEAFRTRTVERRAETESRIPEADPLAFNRFNEALGFSQPEPEVEPVQLASARPPEAPEFASAPQPDDATEPPPAEPSSNGVVPDFVERRRLDLTA